MEDIPFHSIDPGLICGLRKAGGHRAFFDPYPHPVDLRAALRPLRKRNDILAVTDVETIPGKVTGFIRFSICR